MTREEITVADFFDDTVTPEETLQKLFDATWIFECGKGKAFIGINWFDEKGRGYTGYRTVSEDKLMQHEIRVWRNGCWPYSIEVDILDHVFSRDTETPPLI